MTLNRWQTLPKNQLNRLLDRSHTLQGAVLVGLDGLLVEMQARAMNVDAEGIPWGLAVRISGMAKGTVRESLDRISGAFRAAGIPDSQAEILINLTPPEIPKDGTWLDLPLALIMLQATGYLPERVKAAVPSAERNLSLYFQSTVPTFSITNRCNIFMLSDVPDALQSESLIQKKMV